MIKVTVKAAYSDMFASPATVIYTLHNLKHIFFRGRQRKEKLMENNRVWS
jgi:hypothetical protein